MRDDPSDGYRSNITTHLPIHCEEADIETTDKDVYGEADIPEFDDLAESDDPHRQKKKRKQSMFRKPNLKRAMETSFRKKDEVSKIGKPPGPMGKSSGANDPITSKSRTVPNQAALHKAASAHRADSPEKPPMAKKPAGWTKFAR